MEKYNLLVAIIIVLFLIGMLKRTTLGHFIIDRIFKFWKGLPPPFKVSIGVVEIPYILIAIIIGILFKNSFTTAKEVFIYLIFPFIVASFINYILASFINIKL